MIVEEIHPLRWRKLTPSSDAYVKIAQRAGGDMRNEMMAMSIIDAAQREYKAAISDLEPHERPTFPRAGKKASELAVYASRFFALGQNMFEVSPDLGPSLGSSDLGDVRFNELKLPYRFFWLSLKNLGEDDSLYGEPNVIDGVYVDATLRDLTALVFTSKRLGVSHSPDSWPRNIEDHFLMGLRKLPGDPTFEEVLQDSIALNYTKLEVRPDQRTFDRPGYTEVGTDDDGNRLYREHHSGRTIVDVGMRNERQQVERNRASMPAVESALRKVANVLAYLSLAPSERSQVDQYPDDAPLDLLEQSRNGLSSGARQRAAAELHNQGFSKISVIGLGAAALQKRQEEDSGRELEFSHTRRGHFKRQAYGPNRSLRRTIWVEDTEVRPDLPMHPGKGHQYVVRLPDRPERVETLDDDNGSEFDTDYVDPNDDDESPAPRF